jgi:beta-phosphoglucomutase-like phosphatase (HAD superfamily)
MVILDCNGVLVDSEPLATSIVSEAFISAGFHLTPDVIAHYFTGCRLASPALDRPPIGRHPPSARRRWPR